MAHAAAWMLVAASALAQTAKPDAAAEAAAAAAMERAKRLAAGPMRIILEASKSRRKVAEAEPPAAAEAVARAAPAKLIADPWWRPMAACSLPPAPQATPRGLRPGLLLRPMQRCPRRWRLS